MPHPYRTDFYPPFPALPVSIYHPASRIGTATLSALIDTGADANLVGKVHLQTVGAEELYVTRIRSHWGESRVVGVYLVDIEIAGQRLPGIEVIADEIGNEVLLGRSLLNRLVLLLDGPGRSTDLFTRRPRRV